VGVRELRAGDRVSMEGEVADDALPEEHCADQRSGRMCARWWGIAADDVPQVEVENMSKLVPWFEASFVCPLNPDENNSNVELASDISIAALSVKFAEVLGIADVVPMSKEEKSDDEEVVVFVFVVLKSNDVSSSVKIQLSWLVKGSQLSRSEVLWGSEDGTHSKLLKSRYGLKDTKKRPQGVEAFYLVNWC
jgi:hypothetical protein